MKRFLQVSLAGLVITPVWAASPPIYGDRVGDDIFPKAWLAAPVKGKAQLLDVAQQPRGQEIIERALAKYPPAMLSAELKEVFAVGRLEYYGVVTGGTNSRDAVYVVIHPRFPTVGIERVFHAEFSSILRRNHPKFLDEEAWQKINPPGFHYLGNGVQAIREGKAGQGASDALHRDGFIVQYAQSSLENDFNGIADRLFTGDTAFWNACEQHPKLMAKADLAIAFYTKLHPSFTKAWFLALHTTARSDGSLPSSPRR